MLPKIDYKGNTFSPKCNTFRFDYDETGGLEFKQNQLKKCIESCRATNAMASKNKYEYERNYTAKGSLPGNLSGRTMQLLHYWRSHPVSNSQHVEYA